MRQQLRFALVLTALLFSSAPSVAGQLLTGGRDSIIGGVVIADDGERPLPGAHVELRTAAGNIAHPTILTGSSGDFLFGQFRPGRYEIIVQLDGYQLTRLSVEVTHYDQPNLIVRLRKQLTTASPTGEMTTAHELGVPRKARAAFAKGVAKADARADYKGAVQEFERAINDYPEYYEAYSEMGMAYLRLKDFAAAERTLRQSIEMSAQNYAPPLILLSMLLNDQNRSAEAEPLARHVIAVDPTAWRGPYELSRALLGLRRFTAAEASAYAARDLKPGNPDVYLLLSEIHRHTQNPPALLQDFDAYLKLAPQGSAAPQVRKLREQLIKYMETRSKPNSADPPTP
jgi:Carboxypeptidase regulatory-like domain/Tetratricopeptide repeat